MTASEVERLTMENKNMVESNKFRNEQIEHLKDQIGNLNMMLKSADYNILTLGSALCKIREERNALQDSHREYRKRVQEFREYLEDMLSSVPEDKLPSSFVYAKAASIFGWTKIKVQLDKEVRHDADMHVADGV